MIESILVSLRKYADDHAVEFFVFCVIAAPGIVLVGVARWTRRRKYQYWKKETLNLGIYTREWEKTEDDLLQELFDENERLTAENKALIKRYSHLSIVLVGSIILLVITAYVREKALIARGWISKKAGKTKLGE